MKFNRFACCLLALTVSSAARAQAPTTQVATPRLSVEECFQSAHDKEVHGKYREAESFYNIAVTGIEKEKSRNLPALLKAYNGIGAVNLKLNDYPGAEIAYREALSTAAKLFGSGNIELAKPLRTLAMVCYQEKKYIDAASHLKGALALIEKKDGVEDPEAVAIREKLADTYERSGNYKESEALLKQALEMREKKGDKGSPQLLALLNCYSDLLHKLDRVAEAEQIDYRVDQIHMHKSTSSSVTTSPAQH